MKQILDKLLKRPPQQPLKDQLRKQFNDKLAEVDRMREELDQIVKTACDKAFLKGDIS